MTTTNISKYEVRWAVIDTFSSKKIFKYQRAELQKLGFVVMERGRCPEIVKHYRNEAAVIADAANIRKAYEVIENKRHCAVGTILTDAQFGSVSNEESFIIKTTARQQEFFRAIVGLQNHSGSDYQPDMFN